MKEFRFFVEFADGSCDFRAQSGETIDQAKTKLETKLNSMADKPKMFPSAKKVLKIEVQQ